MAYFKVGRGNYHLLLNIGGYLTPSRCTLGDLIVHTIREARRPLRVADMLALIHQNKNLPLVTGNQLRRNLSPLKEEGFVVAVEKGLYILPEQLKEFQALLS